MSIKVMTYVWEHSKQKGSELLTLLAIADFAHDDGKNAYPSIESLAIKTRMTDRNVQLVLKKLETSGELFIERNAGPHGCHLFTLNIGGVKRFQGEKISPTKKSLKIKDITERLGENISGGEKISGVKNPAEMSEKISPDPSLRDPLLKTKPPVSYETSPDTLTPEWLMEIYNAGIPPGHPQVASLTEARKKKAKQRLRQFPDHQFWQTAITEIGQSAFLLGLKPSIEHPNFKGDFDWLLGQDRNHTENCIKLVEGKYRDRIAMNRVTNTFAAQYDPANWHLEETDTHDAQ